MYTIFLTVTAEKQFKRLPFLFSKKISERINSLADNPYPYGSIKLQNHKGDYRIRMGDYRVIYRVDHKSEQIIVTKIAHRREVYRYLISLKQLKTEKVSDL